MKRSLKNILSTIAKLSTSFVISSLVVMSVVSLSLSAKENTRQISLVKQIAEERGISESEVRKELEQRAHEGDIEQKLIEEDKKMYPVFGEIEGAGINLSEKNIEDGTAFLDAVMKPYDIECMGKGGKSGKKCIEENEKKNIDRDSIYEVFRAMDKDINREERQKVRRIWEGWPKGNKKPEGDSRPGQWMTGW